MKKKYEDKSDKDWYNIRWLAFFLVTYRLEAFGGKEYDRKVKGFNKLEAGDKTGITKDDLKDLEITCFSKGLIFYFYDWRSMVFEVADKKEVNNELSEFNNYADYKLYNLKEDTPLFILTNQKHNYNIHYPSLVRKQKVSSTKLEGNFYNTPRETERFVATTTSVYEDKDPRRVRSYATDDSKLDLINPQFSVFEFYKRKRVKMNLVLVLKDHIKESEVE